MMNNYGLERRLNKPTNYGCITILWCCIIIMLVILFLINQWNNYVNSIDIYSATQPHPCNILSPSYQKANKDLTNLCSEIKGTGKIISYRYNDDFIKNTDFIVNDSMCQYIFEVKGNELYTNLKTTSKGNNFFRTEVNFRKL